MATVFHLHESKDKAPARSQGNKNEVRTLRGVPSDSIALVGLQRRQQILHIVDWDDEPVVERDPAHSSSAPASWQFA